MLPTDRRFAISAHRTDPTPACGDDIELTPRSGSSPLQRDRRTTVNLWTMNKRRGTARASPMARRPLTHHRTVVHSANAEDALLAA